MVSPVYLQDVKNRARCWGCYIIRHHLIPEEEVGRPRRLNNSDKDKKDVGKRSDRQCEFGSNGGGHFCKCAIMCKNIKKDCLCKGITERVLDRVFLHTNITQSLSVGMYTNLPDLCYSPEKGGNPQNTLACSF